MKSFFIILLSLSLASANYSEETIKKQYLKSYDYEKIQQYQEAIKVLTPLYKQYSKGYTLNLRFGWLFYLDGKYSDALKFYKKASLINGYAINPKIGLIRVYLATASYGTAEIIAQEILKIDYYNYTSNLLLAQTLIAQGKYKIAEKIVKKMLLIYPTDITFLEELAIIYKATKSIYLKKLYRDILILDPNNIYVNSLNARS